MYVCVYMRVRVCLVLALHSPSLGPAQRQLDEGMPFKGAGKCKQKGGYQSKHGERDLLRCLLPANQHRGFFTDLLYKSLQLST